MANPTIIINRSGESAIIIQISWLKNLQGYAIVVNKNKTYYHYSNLFAHRAYH